MRCWTRTRVLTPFVLPPSHPPSNPRSRSCDALVHDETIAKNLKGSVPGTEAAFSQDLFQRALSDSALQLSKDPTAILSLALEVVARWPLDVALGSGYGPPRRRRAAS